MKVERTMGHIALASVIGVVLLSALALAMPPATSPERIHTADHNYFLPPSAEVSRTVLPDGRVLEVHGAEGKAYVIDGNKRDRVKLPESRRFGSVTVMPGGEVLLWGGADAQGRVLDNGEWFNPSTQHFVRTGSCGPHAHRADRRSCTHDGRLVCGWHARDQGGGVATANASIYGVKRKLAATSGGGRYVAK
jgi:hypothetical protein